MENNEIKCFTNGEGMTEGMFVLNKRVELRPKLSEGERYEIGCLIRDGIDENDKVTWRRHGFLFQYQPETFSPVTN